MADFCKECSEKLFDEDFGDVKGLCKEGYMVGVICEGCGPCYVDHNGARIKEVANEEERSD